MREVTNAQLSLEESAKRLALKVRLIIKDIKSDETISYRAYSRLTQTNTFKSLRMKVTNSALIMIEREWLELQELMANGQGLSKPYDCEILSRFGIACRHYLLTAFLENLKLLKTLLHPRWWLSGLIISQTEWKPFYPSMETPQIEAAQVEAAPASSSLVRQLTLLRG